MERTLLKHDPAVRWVVFYENHLVSCPRNNIYFAGSQLAVFQGAKRPYLFFCMRNSWSARPSARRRLFKHPLRKKMQSSRFVPLLLAQPPRLFCSFFSQTPNNSFSARSQLSMVDPPLADSKILNARSAMSFCNTTFEAMRDLTLLESSGSPPSERSPR